MNVNPPDPDEDCIDIFPAFILNDSFSSPPILKATENLKLQKKPKTRDTKSHAGTYWNTSLSQPYEILLSYVKRKISIAWL